MSYTLSEIIINSAFSVLSGLAAAYFFGIKERKSNGFFITLSLLPIIVQSIIMLVNGSIGTGIAIMGAFSLIRFRSAPGSALDICGVFLAMAAGLASAAGYGYIGIILTILVCVLKVIYTHILADKFSENEQLLTIVIPENLNFDGAFDDILSEYTESFRLVSVKTSDMGSLFKLKYVIKLKKSQGIKELVDKLRCRNGNLEIMCMTYTPNDCEEYMR